MLATTISQTVDHKGAATASADKAYGVFRKANVVFDQSGRGNNWALGYFGKNRSEGMEDSMSVKALTALEKEVERCDVLTVCKILV